MSLMRNYQKNFSAEAEAAAMPATPGRGGRGLVAGKQLTALLDASLSEDLRKLSEIKAVSTKIQRKREVLIPQYEGYVDRLREEGLHHDLLPYMMLWQFDAGDIEKALDLGLHCVREGLPMPERFRRDVPTTIADAVLEWAEGVYNEQGTPEPYFSTVLGFIDGMNTAEPWDLPDKVAAKYYRLAGLLEMRAGRHESAVVCFETALELGAPVKTVLAEARKATDAGGE
jgi:hypothetical protein